MQPLHINLAVLGVLFGLALLVYWAFGPGIVFEGAVTMLGVGWFAQFVALAWSARQSRPRPAFASSFSFALWAAAIYPLLGIMQPGMFPIWFVLASAPIGFLMAYFVISMLLGMLHVQAKWRSRHRRS